MTFIIVLLMGGGVLLIVSAIECTSLGTTIKDVWSGDVSKYTWTCEKALDLTPIGEFVGSDLPLIFQGTQLGIGTFFHLLGIGSGPSGTAAPEGQTIEPRYGDEPPRAGDYDVSRYSPIPSDLLGWGSPMEP